MRTILKGPLPVALISTLLLALATGALIPGASPFRVELKGGAYPLSAWLGEWLRDR